AQPHGLADVADSTLAALLCHRGHDSRPVAAVLPIDILNDLFPPFVLEVHVDIGGLVSCGRKESLEQQIELRGIHGGDAETETHRGVSGRSPTLAQDLLATRKPYEVM